MLCSKFISDSPSKQRIQDSSIQTQMEHINRSIYTYQQSIKQKIQLLLGNDSMNDQRELSKQLIELRVEEQHFNQIQQDIDRQQSQVFDYYELEFNKLKKLYDSITLDHQHLQKQKYDANDCYRSLLETRQILSEDLNARLLQRAELVGQKEELEEFVEQIKENNTQLFNIAKQIYQCQEIKIESQRKQALLQDQITQHFIQKQQKQQQISLHHQQTLLEVQLHQSIQKNKILKNKLMNQEINIQNPEIILNEFFNSNENLTMDINNQIRIFIQKQKDYILLLKQDIYSKKIIQEYIQILESFIISSIQQKQIQKQLIDMKNQVSGDEVLLQNEISILDNQIELKKQQIQEINSNNDKTQQVRAQELFQKNIYELSQDAFELYQQQNNYELEKIKMLPEYPNMLENIYMEITELVTKNQEEQLNNIVKLIQKYEQSEKSIIINIQMVDQNILPQLKQLVLQLSKTKKDIEQLNIQELQHLEKTSKIEQQIHKMEIEFRDKMDSYQEQENQINNQINDIKKQISIIQEQILNKSKPNKAQIEQDILQMNNALSNLQEQKYSLEKSIYYNGSPKRNGVLQISNQLQKLKSNITPNKIIKTNSSLKSIK